MFVYSAKMSKKKLAAILACIAVVLAVGVILLCSGGGGSKDGGSGDGTTAQSDSRSAELRIIKKAKLKNEDAILEFISDLGWTVDPTPMEVTEVRIPHDFSEVYERYNELQKTQGLDLSEYKGQTVTRYTYKVTGHPSGEGDVLLTLLVRNGKLIGGDVATARYDGFMQSLLPSDAPSSALPPEQSVMTDEVSAEQSPDPYPAD